MNTINGTLFDAKMVRNNRESTQKSSGFVMNSTFCDGAGWVPEKNLHTDTIRTSYRMSFNCEKPFHKTMTRFNDGKKPVKAMAYDRDDWRGRTTQVFWKP